MAKLSRPLVNAVSKRLSSSQSSVGQSKDPNIVKLGHVEVKLPDKETIEYARKWNFTIPAGHHRANPYQHHHQVWPHWDKVLVGMAPFVVYFAYNTWRINKHEEEHLHEIRPEYKEYEYLHIMRTPFPWGDGKHSLFHNPKRNPVPGTGYEE